MTGLTSDPKRLLSTPLRDALRDAERQVIVQALESCEADVAVTASLLGLGRSTLYRRMKLLGIKAPAGANSH